MNSSRTYDRKKIKRGSLPPAVVYDEKVAAIGDTKKGNAKKRMRDEDMHEEEDILVMDNYGQGHPFDRLQFGYSPSKIQEAQMFFARYSTEEWRNARKDGYKRFIVKKQKPEAPHFESITSMFKLKAHWSDINLIAKESNFSVDAGENFLKQLAATQEEFTTK